MTVVLVTLLVVVAALVALLVLGLVRSRVGISALFRSDAPPVDAGLVLQPATTGPMRGDARPTLLLFLTSSCTTCAGLWSAAGVRAGELGDARLVVVTKDEDDERPALLRRLAPRGVELVMSSETWARWGVSVAPYAVHLDATGARIAGAPVSTWDETVALCGAGAEVS
jgi:hypothetical protein